MIVKIGYLEPLPGSPPPSNESDLNYIFDKECCFVGEIGPCRRIALVSSP